MYNKKVTVHSMQVYTSLYQMEPTVEETAAEEPIELHTK